MVPAPDAVGLWQRTLDTVDDSVAVLGTQGQITAVNEAWRRFGADNGLTHPWTLGQNYLDVCEVSAAQDPSAGTVAAGIADVLHGRRDTFDAHYPCHSPTEQRWFAIRVARLEAQTASEALGTPVASGAIVFHRNITVEHVAAQAELDHRSLVATTQVSLAVTDERLAVTQWSPAAEQLYGWAADEVLGRSLAEVAPVLTSAHISNVVELAGAMDGGQWRGELDLPRRDGSRVQVDARLQVLYDGAGVACGLVAATHDLTEHRALTSELRLTHDFLETVTRTMPGGLFVLDDEGSVSYMNRETEELLGWSHADVGPSRTEGLWGEVGDDRSGGSELATATAQTWASGVPVRVADDVFRLRDGTDLPVAYSVAATTLPSGGTGVIVVFNDNTVAHEEAARLRRESATLQEIARIKDALAEERFVMYAQPIVDLATNETIQHELLIRMLDRDGSLVPPIQFLPVAEEYGLIKEIDRYVIERGIRLAARGHAVGLNVSAHSLSDSQLGRFVQDRLEHHTVDPSLLVFEITETALVENEATALQFVSLINSLGCSVALDDFGTGYGSFHYLKHLPVGTLKIDREFVRDVHSNETSKLVIQAVISLAQGLGKLTVAEGIEDAETLETLRDLGVDHAQGYFLGRPAPASDVFGVAV